MQKLIFQKLLPLLLPALLAMFTACDSVKGKGDIVKETRDEKDFHALEISVPGKIEVRTGPDFKVEIEVEESLLPYLETEVVNNRLEIYFSKAVSDVDDLLVKITAPAFDAFELNGSADVEILDKIEGQILEVEISGSGNFWFQEIDFQAVGISVNGSGNIGLAGIADDLKVEISGSGDIKSLDCPVKNATVEVDGSGEIRCAVSDKLDVEISGIGDVYYKGDPVLTVDVSGSGKVKKL